MSRTILDTLKIDVGVDCQRFHKHRKLSKIAVAARPPPWPAPTKKSDII